MKTKHWTNQLKNVSACSEAVAWATAYPSMQAAWDACERGDWMLWWCGATSGVAYSDSRRLLVLCACECSRLALKFVKAGVERPRQAIDCAESWARGEHEDHRKLADAASAAAAAAAYAAAYVSAAYAYGSSRARALKHCADIVRRHYPKPPTIGDEASGT